MYQAKIDTTGNQPTLQLSVKTIVKQASFSKVCPTWAGEAKEVDVSKVFADGERVRDAYSGQESTVTLGKVKLMPAPQSNGLMLC